MTDMDNILEVRNLVISFRTSSGTVKAVRDVSFDLERGKTLAIVGESGSGKSVTARAAIGILAGNGIVENGEILYDGKDILKLPEEEMYKLRGDKIAMVFQDPLSALNPIIKHAPQEQGKKTQRRYGIPFSSEYAQRVRNGDRSEQERRDQFSLQDV